MIVNIGDVEVGLGTGIGWAHIDGAQHLTYGIGGLEIKVVVANQTEYLAIALDAVVDKHLLGYNLARTATLVGDVLYKVCVTCHDDRDY